VQQPVIEDYYYPGDYIDLFAGTGGLNAKIYCNTMVDGVK
jgi:hypothetical protein